MQKGANSSKRSLVDKNMTTTFAFVAFAAVVAVAALVISKGLWDQTAYLSKVIDKKEAAVQQLKDNKTMAEALAETYRSFDSQSPNLLGGSPDGTGPRDGSNGTLVLDALPIKYDFPALASSLDKILEGHTVVSISGTDDILAQQDVPAGQPIEMLFSADISTSYDGLKQLIDLFDRSIRPFHIIRLDLSGQNSLLLVNVEAKTYYQPEIGMEITSQVIQ